MYERTLGDTVLSFGHEGVLYESSFVMYDRQTDSKWLHVTAQAVKGPMKGQQLKFFPSSLTTWAAWHKQNPETLVLGGKRDEGFMGTFRGLSSRRASLFGLAVPAFGKVRLYEYLSLKAADGLIHDEIDGTPVLIVLSQTAGVARAFVREVDGEVLDFKVVDAEDDEFLLRELETESVFDGLSGICSEGAFEGESLVPLVSFPILIDRFRAHFRRGEIYAEKSAKKDKPAVKDKPAAQKPKSSKDSSRCPRS